jgi:hypothetical protein
VGGLDLDAAVVSYARELTVESEDAWSRLDLPTTTADQQARQALWRGARAAKELLSRHATAELYLPVVDRSLHLTRTEFERLAKPYLDRTVAATVTALQIAGVPRQDVAGVFLVGGSSQIPLAATLLHRALKIAPTTIDDPQLVVAEGSLRYRAQPVAASKPTPALSPTAALPSDWDPPSSSWPGFTYRLTYPTGAIGRLRRRRAQVTVTAHQSCLGVDLAVAVSAGPIMPLRVEDGDAVHRFSDLTFAAGQPQSFAVPIHESFERPFWVRCFVESPADAVVDDPAVSEMRLM